MKISIVHRYFWPDVPPYGSILRLLARQWAADGHDVSVTTAQPSYGAGLTMAQRPWREQLDGFDVRRVRVLRRRDRIAQVANMGVFTAGVVASLRGRDHDVIMCSTVPQIVLAWALSRAAGRVGGRFVYHCMDLHPESGAISGEFAHPAIRRALLAADLATMRRAAAVVVLSEDMRRSVVARDARLAERTEVIPNPSLPTYEDADHVASLPEREPDSLRIVFTGNIGRFQGLEPIVDAVLRLADGERVELVLMGDGGMRETLKDRVAASRQRDWPRVRFVDAGPSSAARELMRSADLGLVCLQEGVVRYACPSKLATYLSEGLPVLLVCERGSLLAQDVRGRGAGVNVDQGDRDGLTAALRHCAATPASGRDEMRAAATRWYQEEMSDAAVMVRWTELLARLAG